MNNKIKHWKIIDHLKSKVNRSVSSDPREQLIILEALYSHCALQHYRTENDEDFDGDNAVDFYYEKLAALTNNQNDFIDLTFSSLELLGDINKRLKLPKDAIGRLDEKKEKWIEYVKNHLETLLSKSCHYLGMNKKDIRTTLNGKTREDIKVHCVNADQETNGTFLLNAYKNEARRKLNDLDIVFSGQFSLAFKYIDKVEELSAIEEVHKILVEGMWHVCDETLLMLEIEFYDHEQTKLYKFLELLPFDIRRQLYFVENNFQEIEVNGEKRTVRNETWDKYREFIDKTLTEEQIFFLFFNEKDRKKTNLKKADLVKELEETQKVLAHIESDRRRLIYDVIPVFETKLNSYIQIIQGMPSHFQDFKNSYEDEIGEYKKIIITLKGQIEQLKQEMVNYQIELFKITKQKENRTLILKNMLMLTKTQWKEINGKTLHQKLREVGVDVDDSEIGQDLEYWRQLMIKITQQANSYRQEIKRLNDKIKELESVVEVKDSQILTILTDSDRNNKKTINLSGKVVSLETELKESYEDYRFLNQEFDKETNANRQKDSEVNIMVKFLIEAVESLEQKLAEVENDNQTVFNQNQELRDLYNNAEDKVEGLLVFLKSKHLEIRRLQGDNNNLQTENDTLGVVVDEATDEATEAQNDYEKLLKDFNELEEAGKKLLNAYRTKEDETTENKQSWKESELAIEKLIELLNQKKQVIKQLVKGRFIDLQQKQVIVEQSQQDRIILLNKLREKQSQISNLNNSLEVINDKLFEAEETAENRTAKIIELTDIIKWQQKEINSLNRKKQRRDDKISELRKENKVLNQAVTSQEEDINNLDSIVEDKNSKNVKLQLQIDNYTCPLLHLPTPHLCDDNCSHTDYNQINQERSRFKEQRNDYKNEIDNHECSPGNLEHGCSHDDYEQLKNHTCPDSSCSETDHNEIRLEREREIIKELNTRLGLGLNETDLNGLTVCLNELINKPNGEESKQENIIVNTGEDLEKIKQTDLYSLEKGLGITLTANTEQEIKNSIEYKNLVEIREKLIKEQLNNKNSNYQLLVKDKNRLEKWQLGLIILLILKGVVIVGLVAKLLKPNKKK